ncbi:MAG: hypothetical protein ACREER_05525 [Alphaproteobacteria bacterium]
MTTTYDEGQLVRLTGTFTTLAGAAHDPTTVKVRWKAPDGAATIKQYGVDGEVVRDSLGVFHVDVNANAQGTWPYRWEATGVGQAAKEGEFFVRASAFV